MNSGDRKNLYTPLAETMDNDMDRNSQPPAYQVPQQNQQITTPLTTQQQYQPANVNPRIMQSSSPLGEVLMINTPQVGPKPMVLTCPHCRARSKTTIRYSSSAKTHIACLLLSWTMICCCLPYCIHSCMNTNHYCSMCDTFIGSYRS